MSEMDSPKITARDDLAQAWLRSQDAIHGYILAVSRSVTDADDILQNVALAALQASSAPQNPREYQAWAREVARRRVLEFYRKLDRQTPVDPALVERLAIMAGRVEEKRPASRRRSALLTCLEGLSEKQRRMLARHYGQKSARVDQLAKEFGRTTQGMYSLLYRIRRALRNCIERRLQAEDRE